VIVGDTGSSRALEVLWEQAPTLDPRHRAEAPYGSALTFPETRPHLFANFVQTIDGAIAFGERGGWNASAVSMDSEPDRRVMALLRAQADAIVVGAGTFRVAHHHQWSPGGVVPDAADDLDALRALLRGPAAERAPLYVVTASGRLDPTHVAFTAPETRVAVVTTTVGASRLEGTLPLTVEVLALEDGGEVDPLELVRLITRRSGGLILCEGGPHLLGELARAGLLDELFLTVAPQIAGRDEDERRLGLVEGFAARPDEALRMQLHSLRRARDHLFIRYRCQPQSSTALASASEPQRA
jgi:riboflavin biosynthesis pyrimidine reductase